MTEKTLSKADIQREREALKKRLADLDAAERVIDGWGAGAPEPTEQAPDVFGPMPSIKYLILREAGKPNGTGAAEMAGVISHWMPHYPARNVSPKLSLYRSEGLLELRGDRWHLTEKGRKSLENIKN